VLLEHLSHRLQDSALLPELQGALSQLVTYDKEQPTDAAWSGVIPTLQRILGDTAGHTEPFAAAWWLMYAASSRLDHLQDGDPVIDPAHDPLFAVEQLNARYQLAFSYYVLAESMLDLLSPDEIPMHRILQVRRLWADAMLRVFSGQYRDLITPRNKQPDISLQSYQELAQAKTGAAFALAFGGIAMLLTDELQIIDTLRLVGEVYGMLLQCGDDISDEATQPNATLTLPTVLASIRPVHISDATGHTSKAFWPYLYGLYHQQVLEVLIDLPPDVQHGILELFVKTFDSEQDGIGTE
jgi:hypothetical protein